MEEGSVCVANITPAGRRRRTALGVVVLAATVAAHFLWRPLPGSWHLVAELPLLYFGWLCAMQALENT